MSIGWREIKTRRRSVIYIASTSKKSRIAMMNEWNLLEEKILLEAKAIPGLLPHRGPTSSGVPHPPAYHMRSVYSIVWQLPIYHSSTETNRLSNPHRTAQPHRRKTTLPACKERLVFKRSPSDRQAWLEATLTMDSGYLTNSPIFILFKVVAPALRQKAHAGGGMEEKTWWVAPARMIILARKMKLLRDWVGGE